MNIAVGYSMPDGSGHEAQKDIVNGWDHVEELVHEFLDALATRHDVERLKSSLTITAGVQVVPIDPELDWELWKEAVVSEAEDWINSNLNAWQQMPEPLLQNQALFAVVLDSETLLWVTPY